MSYNETTKSYYNNSSSICACNISMYNNTTGAGKSTVMSPQAITHGTCQGYHDYKNTKIPHGTVNCGTVGNLTISCYVRCNVGDHPAYCNGYIDAGIPKDTKICPAGNHTRYCNGYNDGYGRAYLDWE